MALPAWVFALIKAMPQLIALASAFQHMVENKIQRGLGRDEAIKETLQEAAAHLARGDEAERDARRDHAQHKDDTAFDQEFIRRD